MDALDQVFVAHPQITTPRLVLRSLQLEDAPALLEQAASARVLEHIPKPPLASLEEAEVVIERCLDMFRQRTGIAWAGERRDTGDMIGTLGFNRIETHNKRAEIGGSLAPQYWGTGIAPEALTAIIEFGFGPMDLHAIEAKVNPANRSTIAWLRRFGFEKEAHFKDYGFWNGEYLDLAVYTRFNSGHK